MHPVMEGGHLIVSGDALNSSIRVTDGGYLTMNNGSNVNSLVNADGNVAVNGGNYTCVVENIGNGVFTVTDATFSGEIYNEGTMTTVSTVFNADYYNNGNLTITDTLFNAALYNNGILTVLDGSNSVNQLANIGSATVADGAEMNVDELYNFGDVTVDGSAAIGGMLDSEDSSISVSGDVEFGTDTEVNGDLTVNGGSISGEALDIQGNAAGGRNAVYGDAASFKVFNDLS